MTYEIMTACADMTLANAIEDMANEEHITREEARNRLLPTPCCLILGSNVGGKYLHVICGMIDDIVYIISAYYPDPNRWEPDFITRKG